MKTLVMLSAVLIGISQSSFAGSIVQIMDPCVSLSPNGQSSTFISNDGTINARLRYKLVNGDGVSGIIGATIDGNDQSVPVYDSHCSAGHVILRWNQNGFSGILEGMINLVTKTIKMVGDINGKPVETTLIFQAYQ